MCLALALASGVDIFDDRRARHGGLPSRCRGYLAAFTGMVIEICSWSHACWLPSGLGRWGLVSFADWVGRCVACR